MTVVKITEKQRDEILSSESNLFEERGISFTNVVPEVNRIAQSICDKLKEDGVTIGYNFGNGKPYWQKEYDYSILGFPIKVSAKKYQIKRSDIRKDVDKNKFSETEITNMNQLSKLLDEVIDDYGYRLRRSYSLAYEHKGFNGIKEREETFYTPRFTKL